MIGLRSATKTQDEGAGRAGGAVQDDLCQMSQMGCGRLGQVQPDVPRARYLPGGAKKLKICVGNYENGQTIARSEVRD